MQANPSQWRLAHWRQALGLALLIGAGAGAHATDFSEPREVAVLDPTLQALHWQVPVAVHNQAGSGVSVRLGSIFEYRERGLDFPKILRDAAARIVRTAADQQVVEVTWRRPDQTSTIPILLIMRTEGAVQAKITYTTTGPPPQAADAPSTAAIAAGLGAAAAQPVQTVPADPVRLPAVPSDPVRVVAQAEAPQTLPATVRDPDLRPPQRVVSEASDPLQPQLLAEQATARSQAPLKQEPTPDHYTLLADPASPPLTPSGPRAPAFGWQAIEPTPDKPKHAHQRVNHRGRDHLRLRGGAQGETTANKRAVAAAQEAAALAELNSRLSDLEGIVALMQKLSALQERQLKVIQTQITQARSIQQAAPAVSLFQKPEQHPTQANTDETPGLWLNLAVGLGISLLIAAILALLRFKRASVNELSHTES